MNPLAGVAAVLGAIGLGALRKGEVIDFWISPSNTHWAIVPALKRGSLTTFPGDPKWITQEGEVVSLISANLRDDGEGGARLIDTRWEESSQPTMSPHEEVPQAVRRFGLRPE
jgi:hypothetical protein